MCSGGTKSRETHRDRVESPRDFFSDQEALELGEAWLGLWENRTPTLPGPFRQKKTQKKGQEQRPGRG